MSNTLSWKRVATWDLSRTQQVLFMADGNDVQYKITRAGTADKPSWAVYTRRRDGMEECLCVSNRLRDVKYYAQSVENHIPAT